MRSPEPGAGLAALFVGGALALNYPLLSLFDRDASVFGVPLPFVHLFVVWALLVIGLALIMERSDGKSGDAERDADAVANRRRADD